MADNVVTFDAADPEARWVEAWSGHDEFSVVAQRDELFRAYEDITERERFRVEVFDLATGESVADPFDWPLDRRRVFELDVSSDGQLIAAIVRGSGTSVLDVARRDGSFVTSGLAGDIVDVAWTPAGDLAVAVRLDAERQGIGVLPRASLLAAGEFDFPLSTTFTGSVTELAVSPTGLEAAYSVAGDGVWVVDLEPGSTPHQVVSSPAHHAGQFSPDGQHLAVVRRAVNDGFNRQYVVPNHRGAAIDLVADGDPYRLDPDGVDGNVTRRIDAWVSAS